MWPCNRLDHETCHVSWSSAVHSWFPPHTLLFLPACYFLLCRITCSPRLCPSILNCLLPIVITHCLPGFTFQSFFAPLTVLAIAAFELSFVLGLLTFKTINIWTVPTPVLFCTALGTISHSTTCSWCTLPSTKDSWRRLYQQARLWVQEKLEWLNNGWMIKWMIK